MLVAKTSTSPDEFTVVSLISAVTVLSKTSTFTFPFIAEPPLESPSVPPLVIILVTSEALTRTLPLFSTSPNNWAFIVSTNTLALIFAAIIVIVVLAGYKEFFAQRLLSNAEAEKELKR